MVAIYGLIDPRSGDLRYIGKANDAHKRFASHVRDSVRRNTPVYAWFRKLASLGMQPDMLVLSECDDWKAEERRLIASARARGLTLLNVADGGDEPHCPPEVRVANGRRNSLAREADPVKKTIHRFLLRMGHVYREIEKSSSPEKIAKLRTALAAVKARAKSDPQGLYERILQSGFSE